MEKLLSSHPTTLYIFLKLKEHYRKLLRYFVLVVALEFLSGAVAGRQVVDLITSLAGKH